MNKQIVALISKIRNETTRFEMINKKIQICNYSERKIFEGPYGINHKEDFMKKVDNAKSIVAALDNVLIDMERIAQWESRMRSSEKLKHLNKN